MSPWCAAAEYAYPEQEQYSNAYQASPRAVQDDVIRPDGPALQQDDSTFQQYAGEAAHDSDAEGSVIERTSSPSGYPGMVLPGTAFKEFH